MQLAGLFHFIMERDRIEVEAVRPSEDSVIDKNAGEVGGVAQGLDHRSALRDQFREIALTFFAIGKMNHQSIAAAGLSAHHIDELVGENSSVIDVGSWSAFGHPTEFASALFLNLPGRPGD